MNNSVKRHSELAPSWLRLFVVVLVVLGVFLRFINLDYKIYWHDEVYTSMRAAGFTRQEIDREIFQNRIFPAQELQKYQRLKPGSTKEDTINSLKIEDPQHPPLYFVAARFWMQMFGSSLTASRILPVLFSLLGLPLMYALGLELFASQTAALLAVVLLALSPFDILFAQTARQYSLLTTAVIGSSFLLLKALRLPSWQNWGMYTFANTLGLYTHPFFGLTVIAQATYVLIEQVLGNRRKFQVKNIQYFTLAIAASLLLYTPWLVVLTTNYQRVSDTTNWTNVTVEFLYLIKLWILSFTALFLDLDFGFDSIWTYLLRLLVVLLIFLSIYAVCRETNRRTWLFIITTIFVPFLMLVLPDLLLGGKRSAVSRYLISCYPGVQLVVAYLLATKIFHRKNLWRSITVLLLAGSIASSTVSAFSDTWWSKDLSYFNAEIVRQVNANSSPLVISDIGDDFTNTGDLISLSYGLNKNVRLMLLSQSPQLKSVNIQSLLLEKYPIFVFRPSQKLVKAIQQQQGELVPIFPPGRLWKLKSQN
ncbi:glycosyltransferase family 39 protein [Fortiea sp. LEGE XX443]|uniref:glycosyltransferase family 39 protein n=1 Tax=Fortiea sp. LEGE XX443 TaxID=1828611 RepID=UPI001882093D|nr:glycosyltransferase family 39 protein [Fortiea sp. LEGE XX443]MBE9006388.1 glycosyltransferase family 39 protein [Fortiea sp. LEGE XX443]